MLCLTAKLNKMTKEIFLQFLEDNDLRSEFERELDIQKKETISFYLDTEPQHKDWVARAFYWDKDRSAVLPGKRNIWEILDRKWMAYVEEHVDLFGEEGKKA